MQGILARKLCETFQLKDGGYAKRKPQWTTGE